MTIRIGLTFDLFLYILLFCVALSLVDTNLQAFTGVYRRLANQNGSQLSSILQNIPENQR